MAGQCGWVYYITVSKNQWAPFWLATQLYPQNDWAGWQFNVNYDVFAQAPFDVVKILKSTYAEL